MQQKGGSYGGENSNEAKLCNILNLAAGLSTQVSVHIAPSFPCVPRCAQMRGAVLCEIFPPFRQLLFRVLGIMLHTPLFL